MLRAAVLGFVQGVTEFLPVSSSAHLVIVPELFGWAAPGLTFDVMAHLGSLAAVLWYFRRDLDLLASQVAGRGPLDDVRSARRFSILVALATVPVAVVGAVWQDFFERAFENTRWTATALFMTALALLLAEWRTRRLRDPGSGARDEPASRGATRTERRTTLGQALVVGGAQALALFPGVSRSGSTIAAGLLVGMSRRTAARFSFLLSIPTLLGAVALRAPDVFTVAGPAGAGELIVGTVVSLVTSYWAIRWFLRVLERRGLVPFAVYVAMLGSVVVATSP